MVVGSRSARVENRAVNNSGGAVNSVARAVNNESVMVNRDCSVQWWWQFNQEIDWNPLLHHIFVR
ncbi:hypothetical protein FLK61_40980 [Paenalkalicoccus suaedae]|uniref:Uncharacterized protein n=1 Tax=Paenalkalicoccus suaedae TaxID=2592382 RepID=A0A859FJI9_9BACI|nr:hypothetical protein [Paenalkalicoccus suaedae]QKS72975.1 hypothetical protein FLK61_40980 [Paenalkalicoccus suaedae]